MNGKELKVVEYNLTFGSNERLVNVFGVFRYKKNNSLYLLYADVGTNYNIIYYGSSHIKDKTVLSMSTKEETAEIIKEYIYKVTNNEELDNFEIISLNDIEGVEIISSNRLEIKKEVLIDLIDKTIPKKEKVEDNSKKDTGKKRKSNKLVFLLLIIIIVLGGAYIFLTLIQDKDNTAKTISCTKETTNRSINAEEEENIIYNFNNKDTLENTETTLVFKFDTETDYQDFIMKGTMYKYVKVDDLDAGYKNDDINYTVTITSKESIDSSYQKPTNYEEILSYNKREGYTCEEKILGE